jgi:phosphatidylserine decarboxylase
MFRFARIKTPWLKNSFTSWFVTTYKVNLSEAERENVKDYEHFNDFFTRSLKKTSRPISSLPVISPVDGVVSQAGKINKSEIVQAKGKKYSPFFSEPENC